MKKCLGVLLYCLLFLMLTSSSTFAAEADTDLIPALQDTVPVPISMHLAERNGVMCLEKEYQLTSADDPAKIPKEKVRWEGKTYVFTDLLKNEAAPDTKTHTETITINTTTNKLEEILKQLDATVDVKTEDGYAGTLHLVPDRIEVYAAGYQNKSYTISAKRTYPNLSDADTSLIPKTIEEKERLLTLCDVDWQSAASDQLDGYELAVRYTAVATYRTSGISKIATGYVVTADYTGDVIKTVSDVLLYTAIYTEETNFFLEAMKQGDFLWILLPIVMLIGLIAYYGPKEYQHYINKKRGYEK